MNSGIPTCAYCGKSAEEIGEYVDAAHDENQECGTQVSPSEWMMREEGTYNPVTNRFCCTRCYVLASVPLGWRAP